MNEPVISNNDRAELDTLPLESNAPAIPITGSAARRFGDYELLSEIARGGMGVVYRAKQSKLNRIVALKMILSGRFASPEDVKRFYTEAEAAAKLDHPGIVPVYEVGEHEGQHFFSMGFVDGKSLAARVADGPLPPQEAVELVRRIAEAIAYAHERGVIHRDLKPANVLLDKQGVPRVSDFGLAKNIENDSGLTRSGMVMGTPSFMPPEQASGDLQTVGPLSDVYSVGAILYCLLTGRPPFQAATSVETLLQVMAAEPVSPRQLNAQVPQDLETICLKCLEKDPRQRYPSAIALSEELVRFSKGEPILARPISHSERAWRLAKRNPLVAGLIAAVLVSLVVGIGVSGYFAKSNAGLAEQNKKKADEYRQLAEQEERARKVADFRSYQSQLGLVLGTVESDLELSRAAALPVLAKKTWEANILKKKIPLAWSPPNGKQLGALSDVSNRNTVAIAAGTTTYLVDCSSLKILTSYAAPSTDLQEGTSLQLAPWSVALSRDGRTLACFYKDNLVVINVDTSKQQAIPHTYEKIAITKFTHEGDKLLLCEDSVIRVLETTKWACTQTLEIGDSITALALSCDATLLATGDMSGRIVVAKVASLEKLSYVAGEFRDRVIVQFPGCSYQLVGQDSAQFETLATGIDRHATAVTSLHFGSDGDLLSGDYRGFVFRWGVTESGEMKSQFKKRIAGDAVRGITAQKARVHFACGRDLHIASQSLTDWNRVACDEWGVPAVLAVEDGVLLIMRGEAIRLQDDSLGNFSLARRVSLPSRFKEYSEQQEPSSISSMVDISPAGSHVCMFDLADKRVKLFDLSQNRMVWARELTNVLKLSFSDNGKSIVALQFGSKEPAGGQALILDVTTGETTQRVEDVFPVRWHSIDGKPYAATSGRLDVLLSQNDMLMVAHFEGLHIQALGSSTPLKLTAEGSSGPYEDLMSAKDTVFANTSISSTILELQTVPVPKALNSFTSGKQAKLLAARPGVTVINPFGTGDVIVRDWKTGQEISLASAEKVICAAVHPESSRVVVAYHNGTFVLWDTDFGEPLCTLLRTTQPIIAVSFSADGTSLNAVDRLGAVYTWK
ncbi:Serine/threonine-protein kinase PrkC [Anatilimnocola aggregata]|uniref:non-specific serine/threonine protein kinase n=1 Tax=Anatilimnocola aggregata TaxID=2528021 RepID=A0A517YFT4_9BACT|nr:WD40 repeat domain-containing serine/threonine protein kinase [Anatilimnocola aggregata]QDU29088.1 Serine/threonine-protein kinase PrkC [Anatilimnocola aggregata]